MAYALGAEAAMRAGAHPRDPRLSKAWRLMNDLWDAEAGMWNEPGASGRRATIRAAYSTVSAYQEALDRLARIGLGDDAGTGPEVLAEIRITGVTLALGRTVVLAAPDHGAPVRCELSQRLFDLLKVVYEGPDAGLSTGRIAQTLFVAPSSVPKYVQRLNQAVSMAFGGAAVRLLLTSPLDGTSGYRLAGR
jgi:hypothetical protein